LIGYAEGMAEIVNLNRFRKTKSRAEKKAQADSNAVKFGRSKAEKQQESSSIEKRDRNLDGHKLDE